MFPPRPKPVRWRPVIIPSKQMTPSHLPEHGEEFGTHDLSASPWVNDCLSLRRASISETERERGRKQKMKKRRNRTAAIAEPVMGQLRRGMSRCSERFCGSLSLYFVCFFGFGRRVSCWGRGVYVSLREN